MKPSDLACVVIDTTVQPKAVMFPTDVKLGRVLINASGLDVRFLGYNRHPEATLNRSKMTQFGSRAADFAVTQNTGFL